MLTKHPNTDHLLTNFDPYVFEVIKESEYMVKFNLDIPEAAKVLIHSKERLRSYYEQMQVTLKIHFKLWSMNIFVNPLSQIVNETFIFCSDQFFHMFGSHENWAILKDLHNIMSLSKIKKQFSGGSSPLQSQNV